MSCVLYRMRVNDEFVLFTPPADEQGKALSSHTSKYQIHVVCQFHPTLPLQPQLALLLPGKRACRPDLIPKDAVR